MTKNLFVPSEIKTKEGEFKLQLLHEFAKPVEETEVVEEPVYTGPTVEELQKEADDFKAKWEIEKNDMLARAQESADEIVKKAEEAAFAEVKRQTDRAQVIKNEAEQEADRIKQEAQAEAAKIIEKYNIPVVISMHDTRFICPSSEYKLYERCERCLTYGGLLCGLHRCYQHNFMNSWMCAFEMFHKERLFHYDKYP